MVDLTGYNNTDRSATDFGKFVFSGETQSERQAGALEISDTVGYPDPTYRNITPDSVDYFTFSPRGVQTIEVEFDIQSVGDYANVFFVAPSKGVSEVNGSAIATSSGGIHAQGGREATGTRSAIDELAELSLPLFENGELSGTTSSFIGEIWSRDTDTTIKAVWTLDGSPVVFQTFGLQFNGSENLPTQLDDITEVAYTISIRSLAGEFLDLPPEGLFFRGADTVADMFIGGAGVDIVYHTASRNNISFETLEDGNVLISSVATGNASDTVTDIERIEGRDGFIAMDIDGNAGEVYRLYQAAFDRQPDEEGLGFWLENYDEGYVDLLQMADHFIQSAEFAERYGASVEVDDRSFLTLLYQNVLDRAPDEAGFDFWSDQQGMGLSRPEMLNYFSESIENKANVAPDIADGIWYV